MSVDSMAVMRRAGSVAEAAGEGAAWIADNRAGAADTPAQAFRRFARRASRLRAAAGRPAAVAVFGASQAGKSYLVSGLATAAGKPLAATYGDQVLHFLRDMNPQGDKEATGLVTRFTVSPVPAPPGFPIAVRLLSQFDVVKIVLNAFLEDFRLDDPPAVDQAALGAAFDRLDAQAGPAATGALTADDVEELREYCEAYFRNHPMLAELGSAFWTRVATLVPRLPPRLRAEALAPLWGGTPALTAVAAGLIGALERLGFPEVAFCGLDVLRPRETGILNADTVFAVAEGGRGDVRVQGAGMAVTLDKSQLAALVAELTFPLADRPWDFFEHTDLLDFPGARSREVIRSTAFLDDPGRLGRVFLRGKVAYLFQRYNAEQEIAAMLLCVGPSNQDVQTLPEMVNGWIGQTIGATPAVRAQQRTSLFVVLTKFDGEFVDKEGEDVGSGQRWTTRLQASLLDFFGKAFDWPRDWNGAPFRNVFWLRSTAVGFDKVFDYEPGTRREVLASRAADFLAERRAAFLRNESVRAHFADPEAAWEAGLSPNNGGISYLAARLRPVCDPALKAEQIDGRLTDLARDIDRQLRPMFHGGDLAVELETARARARELARELVACASAQRFGALMRALQVTTDQVSSVFWRLQAEPDEDDAGPIGTASGAGDYDDLLGDLLGEPAAGATAPRPAARDRFERFSDLTLEDWSRGMHAFAGSVELEASFRLSRDKAQILVGELERASRRLRLRDQLAEALHRQASFQQRGAAAARKPTLVAEQMINEFVGMLGFGDVPADKRPRVADRAVFVPRPAVHGLPPLGEKPAPYDRTFHADWITALARTMEENVQDAASGPVNVEQNSRLGRVLAKLAAP